mmetsp:Transcript_26532/g.69246  ORF Transcript_26532/g.69246 Transcript_26532/m.69246 type:complete len:218 (-) Transcript_26532:579-1232(-)
MWKCSSTGLPKLTVSEISSSAAAAICLRQPFTMNAWPCLLTTTFCPSFSTPSLDSRQIAFTTVVSYGNSSFKTPNSFSRVISDAATRAGTSLTADGGYTGLCIGRFSQSQFLIGASESGLRNTEVGQKLPSKGSPSLFLPRSLANRSLTLEMNPSGSSTSSAGSKSTLFSTTWTLRRDLYLILRRKPSSSLSSGWSHHASGVGGPTGTPSSIGVSGK